MICRNRPRKNGAALELEPGGSHRPGNTGKQARLECERPALCRATQTFDEVHGAVEEYVDFLARRVVQLGGLARGTARAAAAASRLSEYPLSIIDGDDHVQALSLPSGPNSASFARERIEKSDTAATPTP